MNNSILDLPAFYRDPLSLDFTGGEPCEGFAITDEQFACFMGYQEDDEPPEVLAAREVC
jgi:hypothetical protein